MRRAAALPNPERAATSSIEIAVVSSRRRACWTRWVSSHCLGVLPVWATKCRAKLRGLM
jgi:hypothetical protein